MLMCFAELLANMDNDNNNYNDACFNSEDAFTLNYSNERAKERYLNLHKVYSINNTPPSPLYNCGGYALNTFSWYCPYNKGTAWSALAEYYGIEQLLDLTINYMIEEFGNNLRVINDIKELKENEYAIAYRASEYDFHYVKRASNGNWFHKRGGSGHIDRMKKEEVFSNCWVGEYDSRVCLLAKKGYFSEG